MKYQLVLLVLTVCSNTNVCLNKGENPKERTASQVIVFITIVRKHDAQESPAMQETERWQ